MDIFPLGHASFRLRGKQATVVTDPYDSNLVGLKFPKNVEADIITVSHAHPDHNFIGNIGGTPHIISGPGEYEIKGVSVIGIPTYHDAEDGKIRGKNTVYRIEIDGLKIAHLGDLGHVLTSVQVDLLDGIDILLVPVGGFYTIDAAKAMQVISDIEPRIVIPMHYRTVGHNEKEFGEVQGIETFLQMMNKTGIVPVPKLVVSKDKLPTEMQIVILE